MSNSGQKEEPSCRDDNQSLDTSPSRVAQEASQTEKNASGSAQRRSGPLLVLVNPKSGRGRSLRVYKQYVIGLLDSLNIDHDAFVTTRNTRVKDYLSQRSLEELLSYRSIVVISGDGLLHETVNAMMSRTDWERVMTIPIGIIPTGSGNGLAYTLIRQSQKCIENHSQAIRFCSEQAVQSGVRSSDLVELKYGNDLKVWSFLSVGWGLLANIDIDSEWLRLLGEWRFTIYGLIRSLTSVSYKGRLSYELFDSGSVNLESRSESNSNWSMYDGDRSESLSREQDARHEGGDRCKANNHHCSNEDKWIHIEDEFACVYAVHQSHISRLTNFAPKSTMTDQTIYLTYIRGRLNPYRVVQYLLAIDDGSQNKLSFVKVVPVRKFKLQPLEPSRIVVDGEVISWNVSHGPLEAKIIPHRLNLSWSKDQ